MDLFNQNVIQENILYISGLEYYDNFITNAEHNELLNIIDGQTWLDDLKRRVQHYGYKYDYKRRNIDNTMHLGEIPVWCKNIAIKLQVNGIIDLRQIKLLLMNIYLVKGFQIILIANHVLVTLLFR